MLAKTDMKSKLLNKKSKWKLRLKKILLVLGLFFLITPLTGLAQSSPSNIFSKVGNKNPVRKEPFIKDFKIISQTNSSIKGQYTLVNPQDSYIGGLYQETMLLREAVPQRKLSFEEYLKILPKKEAERVKNDPTERKITHYMPAVHQITDFQFIPDKFTIKSNSTLIKNFTYKVPSKIGEGKYILVVNIYNQSSEVVAHSFIDLKPFLGTNQMLQVESMSILKDGKSFGPQQGPTFNKNESIKIKVDIFNPQNKEVKAKPKFVIYQRNENIQPISSYSEKNFYTFPANKSTSIVLSANSPKRPTVYLGTARFYNENNELASEVIASRWVIKGESAEILSLKFDKDVYYKGEKANIKAVVVGSADDNPLNSQGGTKIINPSVVFTLYNKENKVCGSQTEKLEKLDNAKTINTSIAIQRKCLDPKLVVKILDKQGKLIQERTTQVKTTLQKKGNSNILIIWIVIGILAVLLILYILIKKKATPLNSIIIVLFLAIIALGGLGWVKSVKARYCPGVCSGLSFGGYYYGRAYGQYGNSLDCYCYEGGNKGGKCNYGKRYQRGTFYCTSSTCSCRNCTDGNSTVMSRITSLWWDSSSKTLHISGSSNISMNCGNIMSGEVNISLDGNRARSYSIARRRGTAFFNVSYTNSNISPGSHTFDVVFKAYEISEESCNCLSWRRQTIHVVAPTATCSINWNPSRITAPGKSTISWRTSAPKARYSCRGPIQASGSVATSGRGPINFTRVQTGTEICTLYPQNSAGTTISSCSSRLTISPPLAYHCTGSIPSHASAWGSDENTGLTSRVSWHYHSWDNNGIKCEFHCNSGYTWNGSSCTRPSASGSLSCGSSTQSSIKLNYSFSNASYVYLFRGNTRIRYLGYGNRNSSYTNTGLSSNSSYHYYLRNGSSSSSSLLSSTTCRTSAPATSRVNGSCGTASRTYPASATSFGSHTLCASGTPSPNPVYFPSQGSTVWWHCNGSGGGSTAYGCHATHQAPAPVNNVSCTENFWGGANWNDKFSTITSSNDNYVYAWIHFKGVGSKVKIQANIQSKIICDDYIHYGMAVKNPDGSCSYNSGWKNATNLRFFIKPKASGTIKAWVTYKDNNGNQSSCAPATLTVKSPLSHPSYSCTGSTPANAEAWGVDETMNLTANTPWTYSDHDTATKCQYHCDNTHNWNTSTHTCDKCTCVNPSDYCKGSTYDDSCGNKDVCTDGTKDCSWKEVSPYGNVRIGTTELETHYVIRLNSATVGKSCNDICAEHGETCVSVGDNETADNNVEWAYCCGHCLHSGNNYFGTKTDNYTYASCSATFPAPIWSNYFQTTLYGHVTCNGHTTAWTYCKCKD